MPTSTVGVKVVDKNSKKGLNLADGPSSYSVTFSACDLHQNDIVVTDATAITLGQGEHCTVAISITTPNGTFALDGTGSATNGNTVMTVTGDRTEYTANTADEIITISYTETTTDTGTNTAVIDTYSVSVSVTGQNAPLCTFTSATYNFGTKDLKATIECDGDGGTVYTVASQNPNDDSVVTISNGDSSTIFTVHIPQYLD